MVYLTCGINPVCELSGVFQRALTASILFGRFTVNLGFYSLTAATGTVGGDRFVNFAIAGFVDLPAHLLVYFILDRWVGVVDDWSVKRILIARVLFVCNLWCFGFILDRWGAGDDELWIWR